MKHARAAVAILLLAAACKPERREEFAKRLTEIIRRVEPSAQAEVHGDSALLIHSLSDSWYPFTGWSPDLPAARRGSTSRIARDLTNG